MRAAEIREAFLAFFKERGHACVKSSSLVPQNDPTLFFTNAGMVQFKEVFTGEEQRDYKRACSSQKCMRVSGKHNDLENVGHTPRHHTFFEMLGNFSFGDYFKKDAIAYGWEFLTKDMGLDGARMIATVFEEDGEAEKLWKKHVPKNRIYRLGEKDNFWAMGDTGPCGPCSEILWDFGEGDINPEDFDSDRFMEIWNLVFMQFNRTSGGVKEELAAPSIDTGMGLERLTAVMQGVQSNWETDLFVPIINTVAEICKHRPGEKEDVDVALRVIADHIRCSVFLIGDGVIPSNEGRGYVLRRILRRAIRYGKRLGQDDPFLTGLIPVVVDEMGSAYPELATHQHFITKVVSAEEERFYQTLDKGLTLLREEMEKAKGKVISGDVAFKLYDTFGFPIDVTQIIAKESGFVVDEEGFQADMKEQRDRARASWKGSGEEAVSGIFKELSGEGIESDFIGYSDNTTEASILAILKNGKRVNSAKAGDEISLITNMTPFYGESGGQVGDIGVGILEGVELEITDTKKPLADLTVHECKMMKGEICEGMKITLAIDVEARGAIRKNHTTTHLLHCALRQVLGEHVKQAGSLVGPKHFRFDFSHFQAMTEDEIKEVEAHVNEAIRRNLPVLTYELSYDEAVERGALAFFGEKYSDKVRMIDISGHSMELCGGTHISMTGEIGMMKITSESSVAAGVRRIEAVTGRGVEDFVNKMQGERIEIAKLIRAQPTELYDRVKRLSDQVSKLEKDLKKALTGGASAGAADLMDKVQKVGKINVLTSTIEVPDRKILGELAEKYRDKLKSGVVVLGSELDGKVAFIAAVSKDLAPKVHAGNIIKVISEIVGGKGGGRPDFAQGGGVDVSKIEEALGKVVDIVMGK